MSLNQNKIVQHIECRCRYENLDVYYKVRHEESLKHKSNISFLTKFFENIAIFMKIF